MINKRRRSRPVSLHPAGRDRGVGIVYALAAIGDAAGRDNMIDMALAVAVDVVIGRTQAPTAFSSASLTRRTGPNSSSVTAYG